MPVKYTRPMVPAAEPTLSTAEVRELLEQLLPGADGALLLAALHAAGGAVPAPKAARLGEESAAVRELARVRGVYSSGVVAQAVRLAMSNTLTALQTEAQLLELEPLAEEHRRASMRIVELTRRLAAVLRRLEPGDSTGRHG